MKKPLKIILSIVAGFVLLVVLVVCSALIFINPNNYKPEIIAAVKDKTGRDLVIDGDLKLSFFPSLGVTTGKMTLSNAQGFSEPHFSSLTESYISIELIPLLSKKVKVSNIALKGLTLNLTKNQQGVSNWKDLKTLITLTTPSAPSTQQIVTTTGTAAALSSFSIGGISLADSQINWQDLRTGKNLVFKDLNVNADKVTNNEPVAIDWAFVMVNPQTNVTETVKLNTLLTVNETQDTFTLSHSNLQVITAGDSIPNKSITSLLTMTDGVLSLPQQTFKVSGLQLKSGDLTLTADLSGEHINEDAAVVQGTMNLAEFNPTKVMKDFAIPTVPVMRDANALNKLAVGFNIKAGKNSVDLQNVLLNLDDTTIKGSTRINNFSTPAIVFNLTADTLDIDCYLSPAEQTKKSTVSPLIALAAGIALLPVETLKKLDVNGDLVVDTLKVNAMNLQDVHFHVSAKDGLVSTTQTIKQFYQGEYTSHLNMDVRNVQPLLVLNQTFSHVQAEPLLQSLNNKAALRGTLDAALQLRGRGNTEAELKSSLNGQLKFLCKDGAVIGFSLKKMLDKGKALINGTDLAVNNAQEETPFLSIGGVAMLANGVISNDDLLLKTNKVEATGKGIANTLTEQLDYKLSVLLPKDSAEADLLHNTPIVIAVGGTFSNPTYTVDVSAFLTEKATNLVNKLNSEENKAKVEKALDKLKPEEKEKLKELAPKLGKLFKKLF